jgi:hypothetical protein
MQICGNSNNICNKNYFVLMTETSQLKKCCNCTFGYKARHHAYDSTERAAVVTSGFHKVHPEKPGNVRAV